MIGSVVAVLLAAVSLGAHHSAAALYLLDQQIVIDGIVTKYQFVNPHARIYLDVTNAEGQVENWMAEGGSPIVLRRLGWSGAEVKPGERVRVSGNPARNASRLIHWVTIRRSDGAELYGEDIDFGAVDERRRRP